MKYLLLIISVLTLIGCGKKSEMNTKKAISSCEVQDDFSGEYPEKVICFTIDGDEVELDLYKMFAGYGITYFLEFSPMAFFDLTGPGNNNNYLLSVRGCNSNHRCAVLYKSGTHVLMYTRELTY